MIYAASKGFIEIVRLLLTNDKIDINIKNIINWMYSWNSDLTFFSLCFGFTQFMEFKNRIFNHSALICAATYDKTEIVRILLENKCTDVNIKDILKWKFL